MAKLLDRITPELRAFIEAQHVFFTATAPPEGRINLSPKGMDTFRCLDDRTVAYLDLTGSGNETSAHLRLDDRMTVMLCSFAEKPLILRLYGRGRIVAAGSEEWHLLSPGFPETPGQRQIVVLDVGSVQTSCGFGVPMADGMRGRDTLRRWAETKGDDGLIRYRAKKNLLTIDGLPTGLPQKAPP